MPILKSEPSLFPLDLLDRDPASESEHWYAIYTMSRREKDLIRRLRALEIAHYCPIILQRKRSPAGRMRDTYLPLFSNYVFIYADEDQRQKAFTTNCIATDTKVLDGPELTANLRQIQKLIDAGAHMTREAKILKGQYVRVRTGKFRNYEGTVIRREGERRLLVHVNFLQQGASILLDDCEVEPL